MSNLPGDLPAHMQSLSPADEAALLDGTVFCEWFALCENEATLTRPHPVLGDVPICERCDTKVEALS